MSQEKMPQMSCSESHFKAVLRVFNRRRTRNGITGPNKGGKSLFSIALPKFLTDAGEARLYVRVSCFAGDFRICPLGFFHVSACNDNMVVRIFQSNIFCTLITQSRIAVCDDKCFSFRSVFIF
jgi:hypothetical protein